MLKNKIILSSSPEQTLEIGSEFSKGASIGNIYCLNGEIGSGKTTFMKGVLKGFNYKGIVTSPTFTLINEYDSSPSVIHIDCYREDNIDRWISLGILEYFQSDKIIFIEWPNIIKKILPDNIFNIDFNVVEENKREIIIK